jgi:hypothetical protein
MPFSSVTWKSCWENPFLSKNLDVPNVEKYEHSAQLARFRVLESQIRYMEELVHLVLINDNVFSKNCEDLYMKN